MQTLRFCDLFDRARQNRIRRRRASFNLETKETVQLAQLGNEVADRGLGGRARAGVPVVEERADVEAEMRGDPLQLLQPWTLDATRSDLPYPGLPDPRDRGERDAIETGASHLPFQFASEPVGIHAQTIVLPVSV